LTLTCQGTEVSLAAAQSWLKKYLGPEQDLKRCGGTIQAHFQQDKSSGWNLQATARLSSTSSSAGAPPRAAELDVSAAFSKTDDKLTIAKCQAAAEGAALALSGEITEVARRQLANLSAEIQSPGFAPLDFLPDPIRQEVRVDGLKFSQISIRGPLKPAPDSPDALEISLIAGWQSAVAYGLASSGGQLRLAIADGQLRAEPLDVSIGGGRLRQLPALDFRSNPPELVFSEGPMLENVALTEEVCRNWLKYVSPTLANATAAEGEFSLSTKAGRIPVGQPAAGRLGGTLVIHRGQVRPGPLAMQALQRANEIQGMILRGGGVDLTRQTLLTIQNEDVNFALQDGRVYHDDFGFYVKEMRVSTTGSVGLDQSLDLLLNMELPDAWFRNAGPILQSLRGEKIQLVVAGTLDKPAIDGRPLAEFGKRIGIKAGAGLLERIIERRMERGR
jgi:hypothetical protein